MVHFYFIFIWCKIQFTGESIQSFTMKHTVSSKLFGDVLYQVQNLRMFMALSMLLILDCALGTMTLCHIDSGLQVLLSSESTEVFL